MPIPGSPKPGLKRALGLWALIVYGVVLIQPTAPMSLFGAAAVEGQGHVVTAILIGMVAMMFTAFSYGRMANAYPSAGSAYAYVSREIHPALGYFVGWSIIFDYVMNPIICVIWIGGAVAGFIPGLSHSGTTGFALLFIVLFAALFTGLNLRGIEASARTNALIALALGGVVVLFLGAAAHYLLRHPLNGAADWTRPFYNPQTFSVKTVSGGAALAVLTYIGFDGISTLSEEAHNPRRNILLATVLTCLLIGILASIEVYFAQVIWPGADFQNQDTAFCDIAGKAGGHWLFLTISIALIVANFGSGAGAQLGAGRLLYSMGRDNAIPQKFFGVVNPRTRIPSNNIVLIGGLMLAGALGLKAIQVTEQVDAFGFGCKLLNFGALLAFMGVNASAFVHYVLRHRDPSGWKIIGSAAASLLGFGVCAFLWASLGRWAIIVGSGWLFTGILYGAWRTSFFSKPIQFASLDGDEPSAR
ncbi:MAG TPA: APC family permease [Candidatus Acidoferrales bacterium]|nr:APC family permease [Candidatus Acidoferrales bacterium]